MIRHRFICCMITKIINTIAIVTVIVGIVPSITVAAAAGINGWCGILSKQC